LERIAQPVGVSSSHVRLGWEVFLLSLGCIPMDPTAGGAIEGSVEITLQLGSVLASGEFWVEAVKSEPIMSYLESVLGTTNMLDERNCWLQQLPVQRGEDTLALRELFLQEPFYALAGDRLPYINGVPPVETVRKLLSNLGVSTEVNQAALVKCLQSMKRQGHEDMGLAADIYVNLDQLGFTSPGQHELILVPGRGFLHAGECTWLPFQAPMLQRCCRLEALSEHYRRFGPQVQNALRRWVRLDPESDVGELCDALLQVIACACADPSRPHRLLGRESVMPEEAVDGLFVASKAVVEAVAKLCEQEALASEATTMSSHSNVAFNNFMQNRMIVVSDPHPDYPSRCRLLHMGEAYWSVATELMQEPCAAWALRQQYGSAERLKNLFTRVLRVRPVLSRADLERAMQRQLETWDRDGSIKNVEEGLDLRGSCAGPGFDVDEAIVAAWQRAQNLPPPIAGPEEEEEGECSTTALVQMQSRGARVWRQVGELGGCMPVFAADGSHPPSVECPDMRQLYHLFNVFGLFPAQVAFAYDPSGRCVCERKLFLDLARIPRAARLSTPGAVATFWAAELAHALAHLGAGPTHSEHLCQLQSELLSQALPLVFGATTRPGRI